MDGSGGVWDIAGWVLRVYRSPLSAHANTPPSPRRRSPSAGRTVARGAPPACVRGTCPYPLVFTPSSLPSGFPPTPSSLIFLFTLNTHRLCLPMQSCSCILDRGGQGRQEGHQVAAEVHGTQVDSSLSSFLVSFPYASLVLSLSVHCRRRYVCTHAATHMQSPCLSQILLLCTPNFLRL